MQNMIFAKPRPCSPIAPLVLPPLLTPAPPYCSPPTAPPLLPPLRSHYRPAFPPLDASATALTAQARQVMQLQFVRLTGPI